MWEYRGIMQGLIRLMEKENGNYYIGFKVSILQYDWNSPQKKRPRGICMRSRYPARA